MSDPDKWVYDYYLPALEKAGITDPAEVLSHVRRDFTSARAADLVSKLITQRPSFSNHAALYEKAQGLDAIGNNLSDPFVALNSLSTSLSSFAGTVTSPIMADAARAMSNIARGLGGIGVGILDWQKRNPELGEMGAIGAIVGGTAIGGKLTYNLLSGIFGGGMALKGSAMALDGAAAALTQAAAALGGPGMVGKAAAAAGGSAAAAGGVAGGVVGGGLGLSYEAAKLVRDNPDVFEEIAHNPMLSAMSGDFGIAAAIMEATKKPVEVKGEAKVTIEIPGVGTREVRVPLNGPGSLGTSSPDAAAQPIGLGHR
jgi:hypothetical protein